MPEEKKLVRKPHNIIMESRKVMSVSGVEDVDSFDEQTIVLFTEYGALTITGENLHMNRVNVDTGEMQLEGEIVSLSYADSVGKKSGGFFSKLLK